MRYRDYKALTKGNYYHIYNRGVDKNLIFLDSEDYWNFIKRIKIILGTNSSESLRIRAVPENSFEIIAYCLMNNHFHIIIKQCSNLSIGSFVKKLCTSYAIYFNKKYNRTGHLFQDIFKAKVIENDEYLINLSAYVHNNPLNPLNYPYSSISEYVSTLENVCNINLILGFFNNPKDYQIFLKKHADRSEVTKHLTF